MRKLNKKMLWNFTLGLLLLTSTEIKSAVLTWDNSSSNNNLFDSGNYTPVALPTTNDTIVFDNTIAGLASTYQNLRILKMEFKNTLGGNYDIQALPTGGSGFGSINFGNDVLPPLTIRGVYIDPSQVGPVQLSCDGSDGSSIVFRQNSSANISPTTVTPLYSIYNSGQIFFLNTSETSISDYSLFGSSMSFNNTAVANGATIFSDGSTITFNGTSSSTAASGITLTNASYGGNNLTFNATSSELGFLSSDNSGDLIVIPGNLTVGGNNSDQTISGKITGAGSFIKAGTGTYTFNNGLKDYTGITQISQGTLAGTPDSFAAASDIDINTNGTLDLNVIVDTTLALPIIYGAGTLTKSGNATLVLDGTTDLSTFTGTLKAFSGSTKLNTVIGGNVNVLISALLSGTGTISGNLDIATGGTIAPGNSIGTIVVLGNYTQAPNSIYLVEMDGFGNSTLIDVTGSATLNGGDVIIASNDGILTKNITYTIVHADGGLSGTFNSATASGFSGGQTGIPLLSYDPFNAYFMFADQSAFPTGSTPNQKAVAKQLSTITTPTPDESAVLMALIGLNTAKQDAALDAMSGEQYTNLTLMTEMTNRQFLRALYSPLQPIITSLNCSNTSNLCDIDNCVAKDCFSLWLEGGSSYSKLNGNINSKGYRTSGYELALGAQANLSCDVTTGVAIGYTNDDVSYHQSAKGTNKTYFAGAYSLYRPKGYYLLADAAIGYSTDRLKREISFGAINRIAKSSPKISQTTFYFEAGKDISLCNLLFQPFVGIEADYFNRHGINETHANSLNLHVKSQQIQKTFTRLGLHLTTQSLPLGLAISLDLAWQYRLNLKKNTIHENFKNFGNTFQILGVTPRKNVFEAATTISATINNQWNLYTTFSGERWEKANACSISAGLLGTW